MLDAIMDFFNYLVDLFNSFSEEDKEKIYRSIATVFDVLIREYYQQSQA
jgi:hypothetical protein